MSVFDQSLVSVMHYHVAPFVMTMLYVAVGDGPSCVVWCGGRESFTHWFTMGSPLSCPSRTAGFTLGERDRHNELVFTWMSHWPKPKNKRWNMSVHLDGRKDTWSSRVPYVCLASVKKTWVNQKDESIKKTKQVRERKRKNREVERIVSAEQWIISFIIGECIALLKHKTIKPHPVNSRNEFN